MKRTALLISFVILAAGLAHCGGDDSEPAAGTGGIINSDGGRLTEGGVGTGGAKAGVGGALHGDGAAQGIGGSGLVDATPGSGGGVEAGIGTGGASPGTGGASPGVGGEADASPQPTDARLDAPTCPATTPVNNATCQTYDNGQTCDGCTCTTTFGQRRWACPTDAGPPSEASVDAGAACPAQAPTDNTACTTPSANACPSYGTISCRCRNRDSKWWCVDTSLADAGCPTTKPTTGNGCQDSNRTCDYPASGESCTFPATTSGSTDPTQGRWQCGVPEAGQDGGGVDSGRDSETDSGTDVATDSGTD